MPNQHTGYVQKENVVEIEADSPTTQTGRIIVKVKDGPKGFIAMQIGDAGRWANIPIKKLAQAFMQLKKNGAESKAD